MVTLSETYHDRFYDLCHPSILSTIGSNFLPLQTLSLSLNTFVTNQQYRSPQGNVYTDPPSISDRQVPLPPRDRRSPAVSRYLPPSLPAHTHAVGDASSVLSPAVAQPIACVSSRCRAFFVLGSSPTAVSHGSRKALVHTLAIGREREKGDDRARDAFPKSRSRSCGNRRGFGERAARQW